MSKIVFGIYIAGPLSRNLPSINTFKDACKNKLPAGSYDIVIVDIIKDPLSANTKKILAVPTIIREKTSPQRRIIGDTKTTDKAERALQFLMHESETMKL